jgi:hypothetical protein
MASSIIKTITMRKHFCIGEFIYRSILVATIASLENPVVKSHPCFFPPFFLGSRPTITAALALNNFPSS